MESVNMSKYTIEDSVKIENGKTLIKKERMQDIVYDSDLDQSSHSYEESREFDKQGRTSTVVEKEVSDTSRWSIHYDCIFKLDGKFYSTYFSEGATESQDESAYEHEGDWVEVDEVEPKEVTVIRYVSVDKKVN
jgi:hypothetical protein